jgi:hypothetical protein
MTVVVAGAATMLAVAACATRTAQPTPNPEVAFCDSLQALAQSVEAVEALGLDSTVQEVQESVQGVETAAGNTVSAAGTLAQSQVDAIEAAVQNLADFREGIEETDTVEQVLQSLAADIAAIKKARAEAGTAHCGEVEASEAASAAASQVAAEESAAASQVAAEESQAAEAIESLRPDVSPPSDAEASPAS